MKALLLIFMTSILLISCGEETFNRNNNPVVLNSTGKYTQSTASGNLMATAIKEELDVDIALYPSAFLNNDKIAYVKAGMNSTEINNVLEFYADGVQDKFLVGNMKGSRLKNFIFDRISEKYSSELQVAGVHYDIRFTGGIPMIKNFAVNRRTPIEDSKYYKVAISNFFFFSGKTFPGYKYRNGMGNYSFKRYDDDLYSARNALKSYLKRVRVLPFLEEMRAKVVNNKRHGMFNYDNSTAKGFHNTDTLENHKRYVGISKIQGTAHRSPYYGHEVVTRGIITAVNNSQWYPWGIDLYIQDPNGDGNDKTSDAIHVHLANEKFELALGDEVVVAGTVFEQVLGDGLSKTSIRNVVNLKVLGSGNILPPTIKLGVNGRRIPKDHFSTWIGDLNLRPELKITDGIDFWESLEGMRIEIDNPRVVGFRGGKEELESNDSKKYLSLFVRPDGDLPDKNLTEVNGMTIDHLKHDWNPEIMQITTHHLTRGLTKDDYFNVGDLIKGTIKGLFTFEKNLFGGGDFMFLLPEAQPEIQAAKIKQITPLENRPKSKLVADADQLSIASYNVKNLAGNQKERINVTGELILKNLKCPDILTLVEIQDDNGVDFHGDGNSEATIKKLIQASNCHEKMGVDYKLVNIDPINHKEGGQPGGNIRVAMIYNGDKVGFTPRNTDKDAKYTHITADGNISHNPGRVYAMDPRFKKTRKSLVAQFTFKGQKLFVIGNHLNSKLGDSSHFSAKQPFYSGSEEKRIPRAALLNKFVKTLERQSPGVLISVVGDFNAYHTERSMRVLAGKELVNLIEYNDLIPWNERYTTNHNGNSQPLDYIFVNKAFLKYHPQPEVLHINSNYMGRISDHDPFVARFDFKAQGYKEGRCGWKFLKKHQQVLKQCDVDKTESSVTHSCLQQVNQLMANLPDVNCYVDGSLGFSNRSFQLNMESMVEMAR